MGQTPQVSVSQWMAAATSGCAGEMKPGETLVVREEICSRSSPTPSERTAVRCGASPPRREAGWCAVGVFDEDAAYGFDALDAPTGVAEEDYIAGEESTAKCSSRVAICIPSGCNMTL